MEWLARVFGFQPGLTLRDEAGRVDHGEMRLGAAEIAVGPPYEMVRSQSPQSLGGVNTSRLYVYVEDVDAHFERAREAGAEIMAEPKDEAFGDRTYRAVDLEGHCWRFAQRL